MLILLMVLFFVMGVGAIFFPQKVLGQFGIEQLSIDAKSEVRAVYGGFGLAMALALTWSAWAPSLSDGIFFTIALALAGMAIGRVASMIIDFKLGLLPFIYFVVEAVFSAALFICY